MDINEIKEALMDLFHREVGGVQTDNAKQRRKKEQLESALRRALDHAISLDMMKSGW